MPSAEDRRPPHSDTGSIPTGLDPGDSSDDISNSNTVTPGNNNRGRPANTTNPTARIPNGVNGVNSVNGRHNGRPVNDSDDSNSQRAPESPPPRSSSQYTDPLSSDSSGPFEPLGQRNPYRGFATTVSRSSSAPSTNGAHTNGTRLHGAHISDTDSRPSSRAAWSDGSASTRDGPGPTRNGLGPVTNGFGPARNGPGPARNGGTNNGNEAEGGTFYISDSGEDGGQSSN